MASVALDELIEMLEMSMSILNITGDLKALINVCNNR